ncbi:MAG TPA: type VI secretion system baseplate subunit TssF, partial [Gemmataceae bacterium]|nr:type VI secretion system baseplate subunit TssF [Gemmataceae bacterium]
MSDELLPLYNRELSFVRRLGAEFAKAHPKIAGRLRLGPDASEDPHVERLIQAFAYLNARTRAKLEDDFPELTDALLGV